MTATTKRPRGRPRDPDAMRARLEVRLHDGELTELESAAERGGLAVGTYVRQAALFMARMIDPKTPRPAPTDKRRTRAPVWITAFGARRTLGDWARATGISRSVIGSRIALGWEPERALTEPVAVKRPVVTHDE